jgi:hypothetical protein
MFIGGWVIIIGSIVITTAMTLPQFVVGRFILGLGIQIMVVSAPAYAVEISPPHWRGRAVGEYFDLAGKEKLYIIPVLMLEQASTTVVGSVAPSLPLLSHTVPTSSTTTTRGAFPLSASASPALSSLYLFGSSPSHLVGSSPTAGTKRPKHSWSSITAMATPTLDWSVLRLRK